MYNVLVLAGGGAMGLMQLRVLENIERQEGKKISDIFDLIVGTSVGAINGGVLASGMSANAFTQIFYDNMNKIFEPSWFWWARNKPKYDRKNFVEVYEKVIPKDFMISDCETQFICTSVDRVSKQNRFFKSRNTNETLLNCLLRSFSAPMFFGQLVDKRNNAIWFDGGVGTANMPLDWAYTEALKLGWLHNPKKPTQEVRFTAIGTGFSDTRGDFKELASQNTVSQAMGYMSPRAGGLARKQVLEDQVNRMSINDSMIKNMEFRYIDIAVDDKYAGMDLIEHKDLYIELGDKMFDTVKRNQWRW